jgi:hypothetical protein
VIFNRSRFIRPSSAKQKGRLHQQAVRDALLKTRPELHPDDIRSTSMGAPGEDIQMSAAARKIFPYSIECKKVEKLNIWDAISQARENANNHIPVVAFSKNNEAIWVALPLVTFLELHKPKKESSESWHGNPS